MRKGKKNFKGLSIVLALMMLIAIVPFGTFSASAESATFAGGSGTADDPYLIANATQLDNIKLNMSAHYKLVNDIEFTDADFEKGGEFYNGGKGWEPIGTTSVNFTGTSDGNNYNITNLYSNNSSQDYMGLFGYIMKATIKNCCFKSGNIIGNNYVGIIGYAVLSNIANVSFHGTVKGNNYVGGICGQLDSTSTIIKTKVRGEIIGECYVGGICGYQRNVSQQINSSIISFSENSANVLANQYYAGGIVGEGNTFQNIFGAAGLGKLYIEECINSGNVTAIQHNAGGIIGGASVQNDTYTLYINNCFNTGDINSEKSAGGLISGGSYDFKTITNSYSIGTITAEEAWGGISAYDFVSAKACYYLEDSVVNPTCTAGIAKSEDQMRKQTTYEQWDFNTVWTMSGREDYPYPELQAVPLVLPEDSEHKHEYAEEITTPATHTSTGVVTYTCECGDTYTDIIEKATEHTYSATVTAPTCMELGYTTYVCECGDTYVANYVDATGHNFTAVVTAPTCTEHGYTTFTCGCGETYNRDYVSAIGHSYTSEITTPATHQNNGVETFTCDCGDTFTKPIDKDAEHKFNVVVTVPTCTEKGFTTYTCDCGNTYIDNYINATGHKYTSEITTPATHTKEGVKTFTCICGDTYTESISKTITHKFESVTTAPTCTEHGYTTYTCECGESYTRNYVNSLGHDIVVDEAVSATCTSTGLTEGQHCSRCDDVTVEQEITPVKAHTHITTYDTEKHWKECFCGSIVDVQNHSFSSDSICSCGYKRVVDVTISIKNNTGSKTINYGETLKLTAITTNKSYDAKIYWYVDGTLMGEGEIFNVNFESGARVITVKLVDSNGYALKGADGNEIADSETITVEASFIQKLISFFKNLFGIGRMVVQSILF